MARIAFSLCRLCGTAKSFCFIPSPLRLRAVGYGQAVQPHLRKCFDNLVKLRRQTEEETESDRNMGQTGCRVQTEQKSKNRAGAFFMGLRVPGSVIFS